MIQNICVIGMGGVGGYFGGKIAANLSNTDVDVSITFVARGRHLDEIRRNGLMLKADDDMIVVKPDFATDDINGIDKPDLCFVCVKSYDLDYVSYELKSVIDNDTVIMPLLNGIDIYERIKRIIPEATVFPSCVYVGTHIEKPGVVAQKGGDGRILFGKDPEYPERDVEFITDLFDQTGIRHQYFDDPYPAIWEKYIFISAYGLVGAATGKTLGEMLEDAECSGSIRKVIDEIKAISLKKGIDINNRVFEDSFEKGKKFPYDTKTSYQRDVERKDGQDEGELFGGTIIRLGRETGISVSETERLYSIIKEAKP